jgi:hypothetical protein
MTYRKTGTAPRDVLPADGEWYEVGMRRSGTTYRERAGVAEFVCATSDDESGRDTYGQVFRVPVTKIRAMTYRQEGSPFFPID